MRPAFPSCGSTLVAGTMDAMHEHVPDHIPEYAFIRKLRPDLDHEELRQADRRFHAYVELCASVRMRQIREERNDSQSED